jgi:diguanylate cyclase (GGDEF)-like protein
MNKYQLIFHNVPTAVMEMDYSPLLSLSRQLKAQTVTNIRQFLTEQPNLVRKTFHEVKILDANHAAHKLFGAKNKATLFTALFRMFSSSAIDLLTEQLVALLEGDLEFAGEFKNKFADKRFTDVFLKVSVPPDCQQSFARVLLTLQDITPWKRLERQLRKRAQLDGLTRLLNHNTITQRLHEELIRAKRYGLSLSCMMIDLDHFKIINDKFGHQRGDLVLKRVATMIKNCVRNVDLVGRYGGDEFLLILPETKPQNARFAAKRIQGLFVDKEFKYQKIISFHISLSIGITGYPAKKVKDSKDLIASADKAMYIAKKAGRNRIAIV